MSRKLDGMFMKMRVQKCWNEGLDLLFTFVPGFIGRATGIIDEVQMT